MPQVTIRETPKSSIFSKKDFIRQRLICAWSGGASLSIAGSRRLSAAARNWRRARRSRGRTARKATASARRWLAGLLITPLALLMLCIMTISAMFGMQ